MKTITNNPDLAAKALANLKNVYDPELGLNIVDLGLVYQLDFDDANGNIYVEMTLTTRFCPMGEAITGDTKECLANTFPGYTIDLHLSFEPPWKPEYISEEGRKQLER